MTLRIFFFILLTFPAIHAIGQDCNVDFPGVTIVNYSNACGLPSISNITLGKNVFFGNGDVFIFDTSINASGNIVVDAEGGGKIIIPAGVTVDLGGNLRIESKNSGCTSLNPCVFEIEVQGTLIVSGNLTSTLKNLVWSGNGIVIAESNFEDRGCMGCELLGGCPEFQVVPAKCKDEGGCLGDFCTTITTCLLDFTKPVITGCPSNQIVNMTGPACSEAVTWTPPMTTDNCSVTSFVSSHDPGTLFPKGTTTVTYTSSDAAGNSTSCSFNVTVIDNVAPIIANCPADITVSANASCQAVVSWIAPTFTDNCGGGTMTSTRTPGSTFNIGTTAVTYTATDAAGNISTCSFNVIVQDAIKPVISGCPSDITVSANASCQAVVSWTAPTFTDNCSGGAMTSSHTSGSTFNIGTTAVTYTATDVAGNISTCSFNVIVQDAIKPVIAGCPSDITVSANASCQAVVSWTAPTFTDNCSDGTMTSTKAPGSTFNIGTTAVTYTATDAVGNTLTCSFNVIVQDAIKPVITGCPSDIIVSANASCQAVVSWIAPTFTDNCTGGTMTSTRAPGNTFNIGTTAVTYTATDAAGNISTCSFNVIVQDAIKPVISGCPSNITVSANASCQAVVSWSAPTFTDNCSGGTMASSHTSGSTFSFGTTPVTYTATDAAGNISICSFNVIVQDAIKPVISGCPSDITVSANASCQAVVSWTAPTFTDNCSGGVMTSSHTSGSTFNIGTTPVTYTATDAAGNISTCSFNVIVQDAIKPVITGCPSNIVVSANASCQAVVTWIAPTFTDNCSGGTITSTHSPGSTFNIGTTAVTYTATDAAGNISTCSFNVIVQDAIKPVITGCPSNIIVSANASCQAVVTWIAPTFTDNCSGGTMTSSHTSGSTFSIGTTPVTYTATDPAGNISTCSFNVIVQDAIKPVISGCPSNILVSANASCQAVVTWIAPTFTDNCSGATMTSTRAPGSTFNIGSTAVTYTATDAAGNISTCSFNVIVQDAIKPVITGCPSNIVVSANASCQAVVTWIAPTFTDNCSGATMTSTKAPGSTFNIGTTAVTYTATDAAGNISTCSFNVIVQDAIKPVITGCPSNIVVSANASCQAVATWSAPTFTDNCSGGVMTSSHISGSTFNIGTTAVTYTATDAAGNISTCSFNVIVQDAIKPVITGCPSNIVVSANASCKAVVTWIAPTFTDNCSGGVMTSSHTSGSTFNIGTTPVTYTATDAAGNISTCSFNVIVQDAIKPVITGCPSNIVVSANASCQAVVTWIAPTFTDNCSGGTITSTHSPGSTFNIGTTAVTYTATDAAGNISTCSFNVIVQDAIKPVISGCPSNILVSANASCQAVVTWIAPTFTDNCSGATMTSTKVPGSTFNIGTTAVTYTATDAAGNISTCSFNVIVQDAIKPVITGCPSNILVSANASCQAVVSWTAPTFTDNCSGATMTSTRAPGSTFNIGTTAVTYTATDAAGNISTCSFNVIVQDALKPVISGCPSNITVGADASCHAVVSWTAPAFTDNCSGGTMTSTRAPGSTFNIGTTAVTYTATDAAGNISTCSFSVIVQDGTKPVISGCPSDITVSANASCQAVVSWTAPTFTDNCSGATMTSTRAPGSTFNIGTTAVTYTATDAAGNISTCTFNVIVQDATKPVISGCPSDITVSASASCQRVVTWIAPTFTENCSGGTMTSTHAPGSTFNIGTTAVTYTATDAAGNISTCTFNVIVQDAIKPVITGCPSDIKVSANASCQAVVSWTPPTFTDNCSGAAITSTRAPGSTFNIGTTAVTYTATDAAGNISTCSFNVILQDAIEPVITGCPSDITVSVSSSCQAVVTWTSPTFTDNCSGGTMSCSHTSGSTFNIGTTAVTFTATDAAGNISTCSFNVLVQDAIKPVISGCPSDITVNGDGSCQAIASWIAPTFADNCSGGTMTSSHSSGSSFNVGSTAVTYTATDAAGNISTCTFNVIVQDAIKPVISGCPSDITVSANASCQAVVSWTAPTFTDNCSGTLVSTHSPGSTFEVGTTSVTYTATDASGNSVSCSFNVNVLAIESPEFESCPEDIVIEIFKGESISVNWNPPILASGCYSVDVTSTHKPGDIFNVGKTNVTYTATTPSGNTQTCTFNVTVVFKGIVIHEVLTPNNDGENDTWIIRNIEYYGDNSVVVFDRWGGVVYKADRYDGNATTWTGGNAPAGTYFYTLIISRNNLKEEYKGFVELVK